MKLKHAHHLGAYRFALTFADGQVIECDLRELIGQHIAENEVPTAHVDLAWGCLEFLNGQVDIAPETLARYVGVLQEKDAA
ncbi:DUF2442 domain-containing protein [Chromatium okenii]|uniref:DUF2442 domain-containing protein n=1 Tax=Chromatium okenii TaxID=61644 RepID=UPI0026F20B80|nr:DUF2442 domain-containing protein [Chromatium okenii]MBV5309236.1 DUF2442 domain-containing protein [Chromatium okenii]